MVVTEHKVLMGTDLKRHLTIVLNVTSIRWVAYFPYPHYSGEGSLKLCCILRAIMLLFFEVQQMTVGRVVRASVSRCTRLLNVQLWSLHCAALELA